MPSFLASFATIGDRSEIAHFLTFFQGYSLWFFLQRNSRPPSPSAKVREAIAIVERSPFDPIRTTLARKLPSLDRFETSAFTVQEAHRKEIVQRSPASFEEHFHDRSS